MVIKYGSRFLRVYILNVELILYNDKVTFWEFNIGCYIIYVEFVPDKYTFIYFKKNTLACCFKVIYHCKNIACFTVLK